MACYMSNCPPNPCGPYGYNQCYPQPYYPPVCPPVCTPSVTDGSFTNVSATGTGNFGSTVTSAGFVGPINSSSSILSGTTTLNYGRLVINPAYSSSIGVSAGATATIVPSLASISYINSSTSSGLDKISLGTNLTQLSKPGQIIFVRNTGIIPLIITLGTDWMPTNGSSYIPITGGTYTVLANSMTQFINIGV